MELEFTGDQDELRDSIRAVLGKESPVSLARSVVETGARLVPQWGTKAYEGAKDLGGRALDSASEGIEAAWDWATDW